MHNELKRSNNIGDLEGIKFFATTVLCKQTTVSSLQLACSYSIEKSIRFTPALRLFEYLELISLDGVDIKSTSLGQGLLESIDTDFCFLLSEICLKKMFSEEFISINSVHFDVISGVYFMDNSAFSLQLGVFRNILLILGGLTCAEHHHLIISPRLYGFFEIHLEEARKKMSLENLKKQIEKQELQGELAEQFVLNFERNRLCLGKNAQKVRQISHFDVSAGYDIASFSHTTSQIYDKFIEVKSYSGSPHFYWSKNEMEIASLLREKYCIYLVDINALHDKNYTPFELNDPMNTVKNSDSWIFEPTSYYIYPSTIMLKEEK